MIVLELVEDEHNYFQEWLGSCNKDHKKMAESMIACLKYGGMRCRYVTEINPEGLYELKSKGTGVRVYFFFDGKEKAILTNGTIKTLNKRDIFKQRNDIQFAYRLMLRYFKL